MIKGSRFVSQVVLVGNDRKFPAALIVPNFEQLKSFAKNQNLNLKTSKDFCENETIIKTLEKEVDAQTQELSRYEKVKKIALLEEEMTVEGGELTPTLKVKRRVVDEKYKDVIEKIYAEK
jgi:long-chain acyl-CoA synthetase